MTTANIRYYSRERILEALEDLPGQISIAEDEQVVIFDGPWGEVNGAPHPEDANLIEVISVDLENEDAFWASLVWGDD